MHRKESSRAKQNIQNTRGTALTLRKILKGDKAQSRTRAPQVRSKAAYAPRHLANRKHIHDIFCINGGSSKVKQQ